MEHWAKPGLDRLQSLLFYPTLDDSVSQDHPVRALRPDTCGVWTGRPGSRSITAMLGSRPSRHG